MRRVFRRFFLASVIIVTGSTPAMANPVAYFLAEWLLGKVLDGVYDAVTGRPDVRELNRRLLDVESVLRDIEPNIAQRIHSLRLELQANIDRKLDREEFERFRTRLEEDLGRLRHEVSQITARVSEHDRLITGHSAGIQDLRSITRDLQRSSQLNSQAILELRTDLTAVEHRVSAVEVILAPIPRLTSSLGLFESVRQGKPVPHPLIKGWVGLLNDSVLLSNELDALGQLYRGNAPPLIDARRRAEGLSARIAKYHETVSVQLAQALKERYALATTDTELHPEIRHRDREIAAILWLGIVSAPITPDERPGFLAIPQDLWAAEGSDILVAVCDSGVGLEDMVPVFRVLVFQETLRSSEAMQQSKSANCPKELKSLGRKIDRLVRESSELRHESREVASLLDSNNAQFTVKAEPMQKLLSRRTAQIHRMAVMQHECDQLLQSALLDYLRHALSERFTTSSMMSFRRSCLVPLGALYLDLSCPDWLDHDVAVGVWNRFGTDDQSPVKTNAMDEKAEEEGGAPTFVFSPGSAQTVRLSEKQQCQIGSATLILLDDDDGDGVEISLDGKHHTIGLNKRFEYLGRGGERVAVIALTSDLPDSSAELSIEWNP